MRKITLTIKDDKKTDFLMQLLKEFDFIEIREGGQNSDERYDLFSSAGMWKDREIDANKLRTQLWNRRYYYLYSSFVMHKITSIT